jgi:DNA-binding NtrC family response regulator
LSQRTKAVLVVDPDPATAATLRSMVSFEIVEAGDSARALEALRAREVDVLVCELTLPDGDGLHLLVEARLRHPLVPRVAVTSREDLATAVSAINEAEVFRFLPRPLAPEALRAAVVEAVGRAEAASEVRDLQAQVERRRLALLDLETDFPGISIVSHGPDGYLLPLHRVRRLADRLRGTPLGSLLDGALDVAGGHP